uniref:Fe2OG dioxygenase domain-containing protein n=1 Tax=Leersia perrieri TaxID=77586 RepID=A0A0D9V4C8_9ORYZ
MKYYYNRCQLVSATRSHLHRPPSNIARMASVVFSGADRLRDLHAFDDTKAGVKGLVDAGITSVPYFFHHPPDPHPIASSPSIIPIIDLAEAATDRDYVVAQVRSAAETAGFFQVVNHGVPVGILDGALAAVRRFHVEEPVEAKAAYYTRDRARKVRFNSNVNLFLSPALNWRDTLFMEVSPNPPSPEEIPESCRVVAVEYAAAVRRLGARLFGLLSSAMGLPEDYLGGCLEEGMGVAAHYYPACPEPEKTMGTSKHRDPSFLTVLLQDKSIGGLQAMIGGRWVEVPPLAGGDGGASALVVNIGDLLQLVSNDRFRSAEHRVVASGGGGARVSVACFFRPESASAREYSPVVAGGEAAVYRSTTAGEFLRCFYGKGLDGRSALDHFRRD